MFWIDEILSNYTLIRKNMFQMSPGSLCISFVRATNPCTSADAKLSKQRSQVQLPSTKKSYRMVICLTISPPLPVMPPSLELIDAVPGFFSKIFQNFKLSSAAD